MRSLTQLLDDKVSLLPLWGIMLLYCVLLLALAVLAWKKEWLTAGGSAGAFILGFVVVYLGGFSGLSVFLFFFLACSLMSKIKHQGEEREKKGSRRDLMQVLANGLPAAVGILLTRFGLGEAGLICFSAAVAEAMADTWSSTIGAFSKVPPVSILTHTPVPRGISGGVTVTGFLGGASGAALVALLHQGTFGLSFGAFLVVSGCGFLGSVFDSFLGALVQVQYRSKDGSLTEKEEEDGEKLERVRGIPWMDNDAVNLLSGLFALLLSIPLALLV